MSFNYSSVFWIFEDLKNEYFCLCQDYMNLGINRKHLALLVFFISLNIHSFGMGFNMLSMTILKNQYSNIKNF